MGKTKITVNNQEDLDVLKKYYGDTIEIEIDTEEKCIVGGLTHRSGIREDGNFANIHERYVLSKKDSDTMSELSNKIVEIFKEKDLEEKRRQFEEDKQEKIPYPLVCKNGVWGYEEPNYEKNIELEQADKKNYKKSKFYDNNK